MKLNSGFQFRQDPMATCTFVSFVKQACLLALVASLAACGTRTASSSASNANKGGPAAATNSSSQTEVKKGPRGTAAEARAMLQKAVAHYQEVGRTQALADFNAKKEPFFDRDLYVACVGPNHMIVANGGYPSYVGQSVDAWRDANGKSLGKATDEALSKGEDSIEYQWLNPVSRKMEPKISFIQKVGDDVCVVGAYNPK